MNLVNFLPFNRLIDIPSVTFFPLDFVLFDAFKLNLFPSKEMFYSFLDSNKVRSKKSEYYEQFVAKKKELDI